jgi:hypothetical protein
MDERRQSVRDKVIYGGVAALGKDGATRSCVVRNISEGGAAIEFGTIAGVPQDIGLSIARKGKHYQAKVIWWRANIVGVAFAEQTVSSDLDERLRKSERKQRQLKRRIKMLMGEG